MTTMQKIQKGLGAFLIILGILFFGRALSEGNVDSGRLYTPIFFLGTGIISFFADKMQKKNK